MSVLITKNQKEWWCGLSKKNKVKFCLGMLLFYIALFGITAVDAPICWYLLMVVVMGVSVALLNSVPSEDLDE